MKIRKSTLILWLCFAAALFCLIYPMYVLWPWRHQGGVELKAAIAVLRFRFLPLCCASVVALGALMYSWRGQRGFWRRGGGLLMAMSVLALTALARVNVFELMFHPVDRPEFIPGNTMKLDGDEKVLAVRLSGAARAYPVRSISYHHVVNDRLGGVPIVATY